MGAAEATLLPVPGLMSRVSRVPCGVPSLTHSSRPELGDVAPKYVRPPAWAHGLPGPELTSWLFKAGPRKPRLTGLDNSAAGAGDGFPRAPTQKPRGEEGHGLVRAH